MSTTSERSLFWPFILIGVGVVWLLSNMGILQPASLSVLFRLWPLILIVIGIDLLFGRRNPMIGTLLGVGAVILVVALMLVGPALGWTQGAEVKEGTYTAELDDTTSASITLDLAVADTSVKSLDDSTLLFDANVRYIGDIDFTESGTTQKIVTLSNRNTNANNFWNFGWFGSQPDLRWDVGLSKAIPLDLEVNSGVSNATLELADLQLTGLDVNAGVGNMNISLPAGEGESYTVNLNSGTGQIDVDVASGAAINFIIKGGVGEVTLDLPDDAAVRVDASTGVGEINLPGSYNRTGGDSEKFVGDSGVWQTDNFENTDQKITVEFDGGVGGLTIR
jgi:hypothetical protein